MTKALIVVDVQNDFVEGGSLAVTGGLAVAKNLRKYIEGIDPDALVVATKDNHIDPGTHWSASPDYVNSWPVHCEVGTPGNDLAHPLTPSMFDVIVTKGEYDACYSGFEGSYRTRFAAPVSLEQVLRNAHVDTVEVAGIATDYCVLATVRDAVLHGFKVTLLRDMVAGVAEASTQAALEEMRGLGVKFA